MLDDMKNGLGSSVILNIGSKGELWKNSVSLIWIFIKMKLPFIKIREKLVFKFIVRSILLFEAC